jgi:hypothetical protein
MTETDFFRVGRKAAVGRRGERNGKGRNVVVVGPRGEKVGLRRGRQAVVFIL